MFRWILLFAVVLAGQASAQMYERINYRDDDPFVFCTQGLKRVDKCWVPIPPYTGQYVLTGICRPPNKYGRNWDKDDTQSLQEYVRICPHAETSGGWDGPGRPESTPTEH